jgi:hypothetical protein
MRLNVQVFEELGMMVTVGHALVKGTKKTIFVPINVCSAYDQEGAWLLRFSKNCECVTGDRWI